MLDKLMGGLIDKEKITQETISDTLKDIKTELGCDMSQLFVMIKPINEQGDFKCYVYQLQNGVPTLVREITLKEILGIE